MVISAILLLWAFILILITIIKIIRIVKEKDENELRNNSNYYYIDENGSLHQIKIKNFLENGIVFTKMENYQKDDSV